MTPRRETGPYVTRCDNCGWFSHPARTQGLAELAKKKHSCERQRELAARAVRARTRYSEIDRTPKPCVHRCGHRHGTRACYVFDKCRCEPCRDAQRAYESKRIKSHAYGTFDRLVDAQSAREHVLSLMAQGMGRRRIAEVAGLETSTITRLIHGNKGGVPSERIRPATSDALLSVRFDPAPHAVVDELGTVRRLKALVAAGWTQTELAQRLGVTNANLGALIHTRTQVLRATADKVAALYEEIYECAPPADVVPHAIRVADRNGWAPPICWDEDTLDDPLAEPNWTGFDETNVRDWLDSNHEPPTASPEDMVEVVRRLMDYEFTVRQSAIITGIPRRDVQILRNWITTEERKRGARRRIYKERIA